MYDIREITTMEELLQVQALEKIVWQVTAPVPTHQTLTALKNGGIVIGAYHQQTLIGFSYGFAGFREGKSYLCSHMLGIHPDYRSQGIGALLKHKQKEVAIIRGYEVMVWTFDPLETRNGYLNLTKLHGVCDTYIENCYGEMQDGFNKGLPSDRFEVNWHITSPYIHQTQTFTHNIPAVFQIAHTKSHHLYVQKAHPVIATGEYYSVPVPKDFQDMKAQDAALALDWRLQTRAAIQNLLAQDYVAVAVKQHTAMNDYIFVPKHQLEI